MEDVLSFAYRQHVTQMVVGESLRSKWQELLRWSFVTRLIQKASNIDVHVIARESDGRVGRDRVLVHEA